MRIKSLEIFSFRLPLIQPIVIKGIPMPARSGLLIRMASDAGAAGWGDIAPLPGFSSERLEDARAQLFRLRPSIQNTELPDSWSPLVDNLPILPNTREWSSSVRFGIELALWNLCPVMGRTKGARNSNAEHCRKVFINGLLTGRKDEIVTQARELSGSGYRAVKLKVGGKSVEEDIRLTLKVRETIGRSVGLRLDANGAWTLEEALKFSKGVEQSGIDYIEEPLRDPYKLDAFSLASALPVALDETLRDHPIEKLVKIKTLKAIVIKPTLLGGFHRSNQLALKARELGLQPVVSSAFETGIGIAGLARWAAVVAGGVPVGLDTYRWLAEDVLLSGIDVSNGAVDLPLLEKKKKEINFSLLEELTDG